MLISNKSSHIEQESIFVFICWLVYVTLSPGQCLAGAALAEVPKGHSGVAQPILPSTSRVKAETIVAHIKHTLQQ